jgi:hypothetical protein
MSHRYAAAPWSNSLKSLSALSALILVGVSYAASRVIPPQPVAHLVGTAVSVLPMLILVGSLLFVVSGYELTARELYVQRLLWRTRIPLLDTLQGAALQPDLPRGSLRVVGNGGMFSFTGWFYRRDLGRYRAFVTDWNQALLLRTTGACVVISPADPQAVLRTIRQLYPVTAAS